MLALSAADAIAQAKEKCLRWLDFRARTRWELAQKLRRLEVDSSVAEAVLDKLQAVGLVNDEAYARNFIQERIRLKGQGRRRLQLELAKRGIGKPIIEQTLAELLPETEAAAACETLARRRFQSLRNLEPLVARRRLAAYLGRQGFDWGAIDHAIRQILSEADADENADDL